MQESRHYSRAPITEAILDLKTTFSDAASLDNLTNIYARVSDRFPHQELIHTSEIVLQPGTTNFVNASQQVNGFLFRSEDKSRAFQATLSGFTFNRLPLYTSWEEFRDEAKYLWEIYREVCKPETVIRAALRFVNRLELPSPNLNLKNYLRIVPEIAPGLPQTQLGNFFMQLQIPQEDCILIINEASIPSTNPEIASVILDFDLFREQTWRSDDEEIWIFLEKLRLLKNVAFETSITDETRRLIV